MTDRNDDFFPFGRADGSKEDFDRFITFTNQVAWNGLALRKDDISVPAIIGRKGSGKTYYLRRLEDHGVQRKDIYVVRSNAKAPNPVKIRNIGSSLSANSGSSSWQTFWRRSILYALSSQFLCHKPTSEQKQYFGGIKVNKGELQRQYSDIFEDDTFQTSMGVFTAADIILNRYPEPDELEEYLALSAWPNFEGELAQLLEKCPPICFYLDHFDDNLRQAPGIFIDCQKGLFYAIQDLKKSNYFSNRLHVTTTMRDIVWAAVMESEHLTKAMDEYRSILHWNPRAAKVYFTEKVRSLHPQFAVKPNHAKEPSIETWLGFSEVENISRGVVEDVFSYILRHTHNVPRELNLVGHRICAEIALVKEFGESLSQREFRDSVNYVSRRFGAELLKVTQHYIASSAYSTKYMHELYHESEDVQLEITRHVERVLEEFLTDLGEDVFGQEHLAKSLGKFQHEIGFEGDSAKYEQFKLENALWLQGLLGYRQYTEKNRRSEDIFHSNGSFDQFFLPRNRDLYVLHPSVKENIMLNSAGDRPVGGVWSHE